MSTLSREANDVLRLAKEAAAEFGLGYVGTEHLLLGLVREGKGLAAQTLRQHGINEYNVLSAVQDQLKGSLNQTWVLGRLPGTPHFCDVLTHAKTESRGSGNWQIASEHLLLGLLSTKKSTGYRVLCALGITPETVRKAIADARLPGAATTLPVVVQPAGSSQR